MKTVDIELAGQQYKLAPIPLITLAELQEEGVEVTSIDLNKVSGLKHFSRALGASIRRSHPDVTDEFILNNIDASNGVSLAEKFALVNGVSHTPGDDPNAQAG